MERVHTIEEACGQNNIESVNFRLQLSKSRSKQRGEAIGQNMIGNAHGEHERQIETLTLGRVERDRAADSNVKGMHDTVEILTCRKGKWGRCLRRMSGVYRLNR